MDEVAERVAQADQGYVIESTGLKILRDLTQAEWEAIGLEIVRKFDGSRWVIGDWMAYGEGLIYGGRLRAPKGHSIYEYAMKITSLGVDHLGELASTSKAFPPDTRKFQLPWSYYRVVKGMTGGMAKWTEFLAKAEKAGWTIKMFGSKVSDYNASLKPEARREKGRRMRATPESHVQCPQCDRIFPIKGHRVKPSKVPVDTK